MLRAFMEFYFRTYNSENPEALRAFYANDVVLTSAQGVQRGADQVMAAYDFLHSQFLEQITPITMLEEDGRIVVEVIDRFTARHDIEDFLGVALASGESLEQAQCGVYTVVDEKITAVRLYQG